MVTREPEINGPPFAAFAPDRSAGAPTARLVCVNGVKPIWLWEVPGPPDAPALILLHGWMATAALNWYGSLDYLGRYFRVVAPNLRGHGRGGQQSMVFTVEGCADDMAALIRDLGLQGVIVVGYSMGGAVAQVLARRHPDLLGGMVLCATAMSFARRLRARPIVFVAGKAAATTARRWPQQAGAFLRWRLQRHDRTTARRRSRSRDLALGRGSSPGVGEDGSGQPRHPQWALGERALSDLAAMVEAGAALNAYDSSRWIPTLDVPAAVIVTSRDQMVPPSRQEAMAALLPGARRYVVDAEHDAVVAVPDVFLPVLAQACADLAGRPLSAS